MRIRRFLAVAVLLVLAFLGITLLALEGKDVAVLRTRDTTAAVRETRVWVAAQDGALWVEAATPEREFYRDLLAGPGIEIVHGGATMRVVAAPEPGAAGHERIRGLLRAKYGWADRWVALLQDTSRSIAVRLTPAPGPDAASGAPR